MVFGCDRIPENTTFDETKSYPGKNSRRPVYGLRHNKLIGTLVKSIK